MEEKEITRDDQLDVNQVKAGQNSEHSKAKTPDEKPKMIETEDRWFYLGVSLTALFLIFYETVAFQALIVVTNYMRAIQVIAIALIGCSLGGILAFVFRKKASYQFYSKVAFGLPISIVVAFATLCLFPAAPWIFSIGMMIPFVFAAFLISLTFAIAPSHKVYFYDLSGAGIGALMACISVPYFREEGSFLLLMVVGFLVAIIFARRIPGKKGERLIKIASLASAIVMSVFIVNIFADFLNMTWLVRRTDDHYKIFSYYHRTHKWFRPIGRSMFKHYTSRGSLVERIDMVKVKKGRYHTFYNGYANDHVSTSKPKHFRLDRRLPKGLIKDPDVMVIGTAAEGIVKTAKGLGNGKVVGLEINPAIIDIMLNTRMYKFSKKAYDDLELHAIDARSYLKRTDRKFNIITMMNTHRLRNIGYAGQPEYLHTVESLSDLLDHLDDENGWIILEENDINDSARLGIHRFLQNVKYVLESRPDVKDVTQHFWVYDWYGLGSKKRRNLYTQIAIKKSPINERDKEFIEKWTATQAERRKTKGRKNHGIFNRYIPGEKTGHEMEKLILAKSPNEIYDPGKYNFTPITDDKPFPFDTKLERAHLRMILVPTIVLAGVLGLLPVLVLLIGFKKERPGEPAGVIFSGSSVAYFSMLGLGYLLFEVVLIQRLAMFVGMPVLTLAVVLATMLFFSGLGSYVSRNWKSGYVLLAFVGILALGISLHAILDWVMDNFIFLPVFVRALIIAVLLAPLSFLMGIPFPYGMKMTKKKLGDRFGAAMFGLNGAFSALATPIALTLGTIIGFKSTFLVGSIFYVVCLLLVLVLIAKTRNEQEAPL